MSNDCAQAEVHSERRTERVMLKIPIRVMSFGGTAGTFSEDTHTTMVNKHGALIALNHSVAPDQTLRIVNLENFREADFRVVGKARADTGETAQWGVECLERDRTLWEVDFAPALEVKSEKAGALLECEECRGQAFFVLSLTEVDMLESSGRMERLCQPCSQLTSWVYADVNRRPKVSPESQSPAAPTLPAKWDGKSERRIHKRIALKLPTLVQNCKGEEEIAKTENVSKGGLGVCLGMELAVGDLVTVVCPYTLGSETLGQKAEVRRREVLYAGTKWFYGLRYLPK